MLNVSKRSLVDPEFNVSTFGMENSNFLPSSKVVHSSLCTAHGVSAQGSLDKNCSQTKRPLFQLPVVTALMSQGWWHLVPQALQHFAAEPRLRVTGMKMTPPAVPPHHAPSQAVIGHSHCGSVSQPSAASGNWKG